MKRIKKEDLETLYGKMVAEADLKVLGFDDKMHFEIYDGFAYCPEHKGSEYCLIYPKVEFVNKTKPLQESIRTYMGMKETDTITIFEILQTLNEMVKDGERIEPMPSGSGYRVKQMW